MPFVLCDRSDRSASNTLDQQLHCESERQRELVGRPFFDEGVGAFLQKRRPEFAVR